MGGRLRERAETMVLKTAVGRRLACDYRRRTMTAATAGLALNLLYALYNGILAAVTASYWLGALGGYYTLLSLLRFSAVLTGARRASVADERLVRRVVGVLLMALSGVLAGTVYLSLQQETAVAYPTITMITIATYTFCKLTLACVQATRVKRHGSPLLSAIRNIGLADAAASMLALQRSMLVSFDGMEASDARWMNLGTGIAVCVLVFVLGACMVFRRGPAPDEGTA